jgi:hypothetical protein
MRNAQPDSLEKRWRAYAAGAGAVAAGLMVLSPSSMAEVVVTQPHAYLATGGSSYVIGISGTTEFTLANNVFPSSYGGSETLGVTAVSGAGVVGHWDRSQRVNVVAPLRFGAAIGPANQFEAGKQLLAIAWDFRDFTFVGGPFANTADRFLGLKFELNGQVHYGWAGFSFVEAHVFETSVTALLTAWAYETEPNMPIYAGQSSDSPRESRLLPSSGSPKETATVQPATLGVLALGSLGLDVWRKRENE